MKSTARLLLAILILLVSSKSVIAQITMRSLNDLTTDISGWTVLKEAITRAKNPVEILPVDKKNAKEALFQTQVTTHSYLGALIFFTGGLFVDNGWIRFLGSGNNTLLRSVPAWNKGKSFKEYGERPGFLLIADDAIGGFLLLMAVLRVKIWAMFITWRLKHFSGNR